MGNSGIIKIYREWEKNNIPFENDANLDAAIVITKQLRNGTYYYEIIFVKGWVVP